MNYSKQLQTRTGWDVIVCGGGPSGVAAAIAAAREGKKVLVLERYGALGGAMTLGVVSTVMGAVAKGALSHEICRLLRAPDSSTGINTEHAKGVLAALLHQEKVDFRLQSPVVDAITEEARISALVVGTPTGLVLYQAPLYIDATGDGYIAAMAGAQVMNGRDQDGLVQPFSLMYIIDGIDPENTLTCNHEEHYTTLPDGREYIALCKQAEKDGRLPKNVSIVRLYKTNEKGMRLVNATQANGYSILNDGDIEEAEIVLREQLNQVNRFLKTEIPGFENIRLCVSPSTLGVRESRRIKGKYVMQAKDLLTGRRFEDVVVHRANFSIDIHNPSGGGQSETEGLPHQAQPYDIPITALQPLGLDNLILAGRCISGSHRAHASYRVMNIAMAIGQAAGLMACEAHDKNQTVGDLDYKHIQQRLLNQGATLFD